MFWLWKKGEHVRHWPGLTSRTEGCRWWFFSIPTLTTWSDSGRPSTKMKKRRVAQMWWLGINSSLYLKYSTADNAEVAGRHWANPINSNVKLFKITPNRGKSQNGPCVPIPTWPSVSGSTKVQLLSGGMDKGFKASLLWGESKDETSKWPDCT